MTTEDLLYSAYKRDELDKFAEIFKKSELQLVLTEFSKSKYKSKDYDKVCEISADFIATRILRIHNMKSVSRFYKNYTMEMLIGIVLLALATTTNILCSGYIIFQEIEVKRMYYKLVNIKDKKNTIRYNDLSLIAFLAMFDYSNAVDYILNEITKVYCASVDTCYAECIRQDINNILYGSYKQNLFEIAVMFGSITTVIMLMNKYKPIIRRDINVIIEDSLYPNKRELHRLIYSYRKLYTIMGYKDTNNIEYYSLLCSDPDCDNSECEKNKRRDDKERKKLIYTEEKMNQLFRDYSKCVKNIYKLD